MAKKTNDQKLVELEMKKAELVLLQAAVKKEAATAIKAKNTNLRAMIEKTSKIDKSKVTLLTPSTYTYPAQGRLDVLIADFHYKGEDDDKRSKAFFKKQLAVIEKTWDGKQKVRVAFLGDDIEGELHASSHDKHQKETTTKQVIGVQKHYANFLASVAKMIGNSKLEVVFVPESNHGQLRFHGMQRGEAPRNDVGYIILNHLIGVLPKGIKFWDSEKGVVETDDAFYMHGDKGYMNSADKVRLKLGTHKHIVMGHFHRTKTSDHGSQWIICVPKASPNVETYSEEAGYDDGIAKSMIIRHNKQNKIVGFDVIEVE